jgi:hypothetical protein
LGTLSEVIARLEDYVGGLEPDRLSGDDASRLVELFTQGSRLCAAGRALAAKRAAAANAWKAGSYRSAEEWLAAKTKTSRSSAAESLETAARIEALPATREAFVSGRVSSEQAAAIAAAATADPTAEEFMLAEADRASLAGLQKTSRALVAAARKSQAADRARIHASRYLRSWTSADGAFEGRFRLTPDAGAVVLAALDAERREVFAQAKAHGQFESGDAYNADALVNLARNTLELQDTPEPDGKAPDGVDPDADAGADVDADDEADDDADAGNGETDSALSADANPDSTRDTAEIASDEALADAEAASDEALADSIDHQPSGQPQPTRRSPPQRPPHKRSEGRGRRRRRGRTPPSVVHIRVDLDALLRGHTEPGEVCEAVGIGPVSVETTQGALCDSIIRLLNIKDGRVIDICHAGRTIPTKLARALEERDRTCCVPTCDAARHLQNHHLHPVNFLGPTSLQNLARVCPYHHEQITHQGAQLTGTPGDWTWHPPGSNVPYPRATPPSRNERSDDHSPAHPVENLMAEPGAPSGQGALALVDSTS